MYGQSRKVVMIMGISFAITKLWIFIQAGFFAAKLEGVLYPYLIISAGVIYLPSVHFSYFDPSPWDTYALLRTAQYLAILLFILDTATFL